jgi:hypothetical protein
MSHHLQALSDVKKGLELKYYSCDVKGGRVMERPRFIYAIHINTTPEKLWKPFPMWFLAW